MKRPLCVVCLILLCFSLAGCLPESANQVTVPVTRAAIDETTAETAEPAPSTTETATATPTPLPSPTPASTEAATLPEPPVRENVDNLTTVAAGAIAYVQNEQLFIRNLADGNTIPVHTEPCPEDVYCALAYLKWSPDGQQLLYTYYGGGINSSSLRVSDRQGNVQIIDDVAFMRPGEWSPDGRTIVYFKQTGTYVEPTETQPGGWPNEVWTVPVTESGSLGEPQLVGSRQPTEGGCGGGGRSSSEVLYENEGGTAYGYRMSLLEWSAQDVLLYSLDCTNIGIGRFDMSTGTELPGFDQPLRNLVLNNSGDRWYAVTGYAWDHQTPDYNQLVTGTPDSTAITVIPTSAKVELVFVGQSSGSLYYTERNQLERESLDDIGLYFGFFEAALWRIQPDGSGEERLLFGEDDHAYAQVEETAVGDLLFVLVEDDRPLFEAAQFPELDEEARQAYFPQRHIMQLPASGGDPVMILSSAGQPALTLP